MTFEELRTRRHLNVMLVEDIENMFWQDFTVSILEGGSHTERKLFWDLLEAELSDLAGRAIAFLVEQKEDEEL